MPIKTLLVTKGHPFEKGPFFKWIDGVEGLDVTHIEHPAAESFIGAGLGAPYDLWLMYDMPGYDFKSTGGVDFIDPNQGFKYAISHRLQAQKKPILFLHHALAGWPTWPTYGEIVGGRFLYRAGDVRGARKLDSGYRHDVTYQVTLAEHAVCDGVSPFKVQDELYLAEVFEEDVLPIAWSDYDFTGENFYSASRAVDGEMFSNDGWDHPPGSNVVAWLNAYEQAPIGYLQMGDGPTAYANRGVTRLLSNMVHWLVSQDAAHWAKEWQSA
ncbi:MAG: ThuA domain-containing protein [Pseudomonadota bacterium]